ncbi:hypothetical protein CPB83DRAFT_894720 [Crepidotus variabilis]|uniref:MYND-type domain-containing protein n=1 Tax=Crepidotus variabilis TaxID=179855 RepID=A0A9P6JP14_9AGAR|nr:hypothetical protein CPB83DRAFT_894720 [Crepidotus variabilis]
MGHPVTLSPTKYFQPIGETPPVCLTDHLAPELDAEGLLLGCGDPRSILFTIHHGLNNDKRSIDFTCCDVESAVLARNIILFTLIADDASNTKAWQIFYHLLLELDSVRILLVHCRKLYAASKSLATWNASRYGRFLRFCTAHSLAEISKFYPLYIKDLTLALNPQSQEAATVSNKYFDRMAETKVKVNHTKDDTAVARAAAPLTSFVKTTSGFQGQQFYWSFGITMTRDNYDTKLPTELRANPLFGYTSVRSGFNVCPRTNPIVSYSIAPELVRVKGNPYSGPKASAADLGQCAKDQFSSWCESFRKKIRRIDLNEKSRLVIRFFAGDALALCQALHITATEKEMKTSVRAGWWSLQEVDFCDQDYGPNAKVPAPVKFNLIDTSTVSDDVGLVNLVIAATPLLQRKPWSVLHTHTFQQTTTLEAKALEERLFGHVSTMSLFFGVTPTSHIYHTASHSKKDEEAILIHELAEHRPWHFRQRISWKFPATIVLGSSPLDVELDGISPVLVCEEHQLAEFLNSVFMKMSLEDAFIRGMKREVSQGDMDTLQRISLRYNHANFVDFLVLVKSRVQVNWEEVMAYLVDLLLRPGAVLTRDFEELFCQLHVRGLYTYTTLKTGYIQRQRTPGDIFHGWREVPPVVTIVLKIPRIIVNRLLELNPTNIGLPPVIYCDMATPKSTHAFFSILPTFGDVSVTGRGEYLDCSINNDPAGWKGASPMIVAFEAPSYLLTSSGLVRSIGLAIRSSQENSAVLKEKRLFGSVFRTSPADQGHVFILRRTMAALEPFQEPSSFGNRGPRISVEFSQGNKISTLTIRETIVANEAVVSLTKGATVNVQPIADTCLRISFKNFAKNLVYPLPIQTQKTVTRVARKSLYVSAYIRSDFENILGTYPSMNLFPISRTPTSFNLQNVHYLNLDMLPLLRLHFTHTDEKFPWLLDHLQRMCSMTEQLHFFNKPPTARAQSTLAFFKFNLTHLISCLSGAVPEKVKNMMLISSPTTGPRYAIFLNGLRLDITGQTVTLDTCVVHLTRELASLVESRVEPELLRLPNIVATIDQELLVWRQALPAFAERCRTWAHGPFCEYREFGIPVSADDDCEISPLCSCGLGKNLDKFGSLQEWEDLRPLATRVAIGPTFSFGTRTDRKYSAEESPDIGGSTAPDFTSYSFTKCAQCGSAAKKLKTCAKCLRPRYCSRECQKLHWKSAHKTNCL